MAKYYAITTGGKGYPSQFLCLTCFSFDPERFRGADKVEECTNDRAPRAEEAGTFCDSCDVPLAEPDDDIKIESLDPAIWEAADDVEAEAAQS